MNVFMLKSFKSVLQLTCTKIKQQKALKVEWIFTSHLANCVDNSTCKHKSRSRCRQISDICAYQLKKERMERLMIACRLINPVQNLILLEDEKYMYALKLSFQISIKPSLFGKS